MLEVKVSSIFNLATSYIKPIQPLVGILLLLSLASVMAITLGVNSQLDFCDYPMQIKRGIRFLIKNTEL